MKLGLGLKFGTSLNLTPQLQQAIRILQLSSLELEHEIQNQLEVNPLLEVPEEEIDIEQPSIEESTVILSDCLNQNSLSDLPVDTQWDDIYTISATTTAHSGEGIDLPLRQSVSLKDHIQQQIQLLHLSTLDRLIARTLLDDIDERGYLQTSTVDLCDSIQDQLDYLLSGQENIIEEHLKEWMTVELHQVETVLHALQNLEPSGIFARDLTECLILQVKQSKAPSSIKDATLKVLEYTELLLTQEKKRLLKAAQMSEQMLDGVFDFLKAFNPNPGASFQNDNDIYQTPDVIVTRKHYVWEVQLNTDHMPKLRINHMYASMIKRADDSESNQYLRQHLVEAKNFIKSIEERNKTLLKVASCIVKYQQDFLANGAEFMKPLILKDVADEVELHESTVSRVTSQKYLLTPQGLFELKYFFSSHVSTSAGGACSSTAIRAKIKKLIKEEDSRKPLSDQALSKILADEGIEVARRTVAKYRESLNIPSSSERKCLL